MAVGFMSGIQVFRGGECMQVVGRGLEEESEGLRHYGTEERNRASGMLDGGRRVRRPHDHA